MNAEWFLCLVELDDMNISKLLLFALFFSCGRGIGRETPLTQDNNTITVAPRFYLLFITTLGVFAVEN
jgi:hypothetical protein